MTGCQSCARSGARASGSLSATRDRPGSPSITRRPRTIRCRRPGAAWLGRDPETGAPVPQPDLPGIAEVTADPRRLRVSRDAKAADAARAGPSVGRTRRGRARGSPAGSRHSSCRRCSRGPERLLALRETVPCPPSGACRCLRRGDRAFRAAAVRGNGPPPHGRLTPRRRRCWCAGAILTCSGLGSST